LLINGPSFLKTNKETISDSK